MTEKIIILDFGSQVTQLIGRRLRELNVYCEIYPFNKVPALGDDVKGVILSGSPCSVRDTNAPPIDSPFSEYAMERNIWLINSEARWKARLLGNTVEPCSI